MRRSLVGAALATACLLAAAAPAAHGARVELSQACAPGEPAPCRWTLTYAADGGETNQLRITLDGTSALVHDGGAVIVPAGSGCTAEGANYRCTAPAPIGRVDVTLGDLNDEGVVAGDPVSTSGHPGTVTIHGGEGNDFLTAPDTPDVLHGGGGVDVLHAGGGDDLLSDSDVTGGFSSDVFDGGSGDDVASYAPRTKPVTVDLRTPESSHSAGEANEGDFMLDVEGAIGGSGDDVLLGNGLDNDFDGGDGRDTIRGGDGDDRVANGEIVRCGADQDLLVAARIARAPRDCEAVGLAAGGGLATTARARPVRGRKARFRVTCERGTAARSCRGRLRLRRGGRVIGSARVSVRPGRARTIAIPCAGAKRGQRATLEFVPAGRKAPIASYGIRL